MAVTVKTLFNNGAYLYQMKLIAGREGLGNLVHWVHIIEDDDASAFLHGGELVFTAGILNRRHDWLSGFVHKLLSAGASAFVVNLGPHTTEIPAEVSALCDKAGLPLFTIPWETRMVDMTRDFCQRLIQAEQTEQSIMTAMKNLLFHVGEQEPQVLLMERHGFQRNAQYCFVCVQPDEPGDPEAVRLVLKNIAERKAREMGGLHVSFTYHDARVFLLSNFPDDDIDSFVMHFMQEAAYRLPTLHLRMGLSPNLPGLCDQIGNFEKAMAALDAARKGRESLVRYEQLGLLKILYAVKDKSVLKQYHTDVLGRLDAFDAENGASLCALLKDYLALEGSLQAVAEKHFVHRNTVTNALRRIETLTGIDPSSINGKVVFSLALRVREIS